MTEAKERQSTDVHQSRSDRARTLESLHSVERHAAAPGPGRANEWRDDLLAVLADLGSSLQDQYQRSSSEDGLLRRVVDEAPRLEPAVRDLHRRQSELIEEVDDLQQSLADLSHVPDVDVVRSRIAEMTAEIRELRAWETDIVYDAYAFDLGTGD